MRPNLSFENIASVLAALGASTLVACGGATPPPVNASDVNVPAASAKPAGQASCSASGCGANAAAAPAAPAESSDRRCRGHHARGFRHACGPRCCFSPCGQRRRRRSRLQRRGPGLLGPCSPHRGRQARRQEDQAQGPPGRRGELRSGHLLGRLQAEDLLSDAMSGRGRARVGLGLRWEFLDELVQRTSSGAAPAIDLLEIAPENYMRRGGWHPRALAELAGRYPLLTHGLTMSLGGVDPLDAGYLADLRAFVRDVGDALALRPPLLRQRRRPQPARSAAARLPAGDGRARRRPHPPRAGRPRRPAGRRERQLLPAPRTRRDGRGRVRGAGLRGRRLRADAGREQRLRELPQLRVRRRRLDARGAARPRRADPRRRAPVVRRRCRRAGRRARGACRGRAHRRHPRRRRARSRARAARPRAAAHRAPCPWCSSATRTFPISTGCCSSSRASVAWSRPRQPGRAPSSTPRSPRSASSRATSASTAAGAIPCAAHARSTACPSASPAASAFDDVAGEGRQLEPAHVVVGVPVAEQRDLARGGRRRSPPRRAGSSWTAHAERSRRIELVEGEGTVERDLGERRGARDGSPRRDRELRQLVAPRDRRGRRGTLRVGSPARRRPRRRARAGTSRR